jgi:hypothetical protein
VFIIRKAHMEAFEKAAVEGFEDRMLDHLRRFLPRHCEASGEASIRRLSQQDVCLYISLMVMLGSGFDADPQLPWAAAILKEKSETRPEVMTTALCTRAMGYLDRVEGQNSEYLERVLRTMFRHPLYDAWQPLTGDFERDVVDLLLRTWRKKCEDMGHDAMHGLVESGLQAASRYGIKSQCGMTVYVGLMLLLGSSFDSDPQFQWAQSILNEPSLSDESERVKKLYGSAVEHLKRLVPRVAHAGA